MKMIIGKPPIYDDAVAVFGPLPEHVIFAYGDTIYNPSGAYIFEDVIAHEEIHELQQGNDPVDWWRKYLADPEFRLDQELEAYKHQYKFICNQTKSREQRNHYLIHFAKTLSGPIYGNLLTMQDAIEKIKE